MAIIQPPHGTLHRFEDMAEMADGARQALVDLARSTVAANGAFHVALSGGSTPRKLYEMLAREDLPWEAIRWYWGDERNVPHDHEDSNFRMVKEAMLDPANVPAANVFPVPVDVADPAATAGQYEATLRDQFSAAPWPEFDLVLLGMGDDAHTASLFPETSAIEQDERWFVENWIPKFDAHRLTLTAGAINAAANIWFMISGANKRGAISQVWGSDRQPRLYPAQLIRPHDGVLWWLVSLDALPDVP